MAGPTPTPTPKTKYTNDVFNQARANQQAAGQALIGGSKPSTSPTPAPSASPAPLTGNVVNPPNFNAFGEPPTDPAAAAAFAVNAAQGGAGSYMGYTGTQTVGPGPIETTNTQLGGGGGKGSAQRLPVNGPYVLGADGRIHYIAPPSGFLSDFAGDPDSESGWIWNPNFQQYQRVQWNSKLGKWEAGTRFMEGPPVNAAGQLTPGLPLVGGLQGRYPGEPGFGQPQPGEQGMNPGTALFPINPRNVPFLPRSLAPAQGPNAGQNIAFSSLGMPMLSEGMGNADAGQIGGRLVGAGETRPSQIEIRSPAGGYGIGVDTAQILAANGVKPTGNAETDQALTTAILARRGELEQAGVPALVASEIVRQEVKSKSGQSSAVQDLGSEAGFARGGTIGVNTLRNGSPNPAHTLMANEPMALIGMRTGRMHAMMGEAGPERVDVTPMGMPRMPMAQQMPLRMQDGGTVGISMPNFAIDPRTNQGYDPTEGGRRGRQEPPIPAQAPEAMLPGQQRLLQGQINNVTGGDNPLYVRAGDFGIMTNPNYKAPQSRQPTPQGYGGYWGGPGRGWRAVPFGNLGMIQWGGYDGPYMPPPVQGPPTAVQPILRLPPVNPEYAYASLPIPSLNNYAPVIA